MVLRRLLDPSRHCPRRRLAKHVGIAAVFAYLYAPDALGFRAPRGYICAAAALPVAMEIVDPFVERKRREKGTRMEKTDKRTDEQPAADAATQPSTPHGPIERAIESVIFASRWLLAPIYIGLVGALLALLVKFAQHTYELAGHVMTSSGDEIIIAVLGLVDITLMGSLVLVVMFAGYENFVSNLDVAGHKDRPSWMGHVDFTDLKLKLMASIVAISAIHVLESFMNVTHLTDRELGWSVGIHLTFVVSAVLLALMDRLSGKAHG
jgi:uncharacterized protein (TIGR00645 family)